MKHLCLTIAAICCSMWALAGNDNYQTSYNYQRGIDAIERNELAEGVDYLQKELQEHPKNGYAHLWIGVAYAYVEDYARSLTALNKAQKYLPQKDRENMAWSYKVRAIVNLAIEDTISALKDYTQAIKINPVVPDYYEQRADVLFELARYDESNADYEQMLKLNSGNEMARMGIGRNLKMQGKYEEAIECFSSVVRMTKDYSSCYSFRAECYLALKKYKEGIDDIITALNIDNDKKALYLAGEIDNEAMPLLVARLKKMIIESPNTPENYLYLAIVYDEHNKAAEAIPNYSKLYELTGAEAVRFNIAKCYFLVGKYNQAIKYAELYHQGDSTDIMSMLLIADAYNEIDSITQALQWIDMCIAREPDNGYAYYRRGWFLDKVGIVDEAIETYSLAIALNPTYAYSYCCRGALYELKGETEKCRKDMQKVLELEPNINDNACAQFAYLALGDTIAAINFMDSILAHYSNETYDAACLYSRIGDTSKALDYFEQTLKNGFVRFKHIQKDRDLDNIRNIQRFKELYYTYYHKWLESVRTDEEAAQSSTIGQIYEIPFIRSNGVTKVACKINDLPLNFVFDTGASDVTMSMIEASFMMKNGYLDTKDIIGSQHYQTADGNVLEGTTLNLRNIDFGGCQLNNIRASVVQNQDAPLLLGQSVLQRLGKIEIDNEKQIIKIISK